MPLAPGTRLGRYEIVALLGAGGMGEVYAAKDPRLGRDVAIKILPADVVSDPERLARFEREAQAVSTLNHPHIVTLYEVGTSDDGPYLVLEKIDGRSLLDLLSSGPLPIRRLLTIGAQVAEGLAKAHAAGIVHRDLKPANVMVTADGFAKILDFGVAKLVWPELDSRAIEAATTLTQRTSTGLIVGTPGYLSPEQAMGKPVDHRVDQFALGALLYEMATGQRPFRRDTMVESLTATIREDPEPLRSKRPDAPAQLEWLVERCLAKDPDDRYASTRDLARDLVDLRDHLSDITRSPLPDTTAAGVPARRRRWIGWVLASLVLAVVAAGSFVAARRTAADVAPPTYRPLTFRRGTITGARFSPDGKTVYYSAAYGSEPSRVYVTHLERTESELLKLPPAFLLGVSSKDELLVLLTNGRNAYASPGTLARVPAVGGTPRLLIDDARYGDWAPDGERVAAILGGRRQLEFPIGRSVPGRWAMARVSPQVDRMALMTSGGRLQIQDSKGQQLAADTVTSVYGIAWSPDGRELWYTGSESGGAHDRALYALSLNGTRRLIARAPGAMTIYDVAQDRHSALIATGAGWSGIAAGRVGQEQETPLDLLGRSEIVDLSADGKWLLVNERREVGSGVYRRSTDGIETTHLTDDEAIGLSPDGAWALVYPRGNPRRLMLVPAGAGVTRELPLDSTLEVSTLWPARWSPDGRRLFVLLRPVGGDDRAARIFMRAGDRPWQAVTPAGVAGPFAVAPDGETVATGDASGSVALFPIGGGAPRRLEGERGVPIHWSADRRELFLVGSGQLSLRVYRHDLATGRVEPWRDIGPADATGVMAVQRILIASDDRSYVYAYNRGLNDLYLAQGLR